MASNNNLSDGKMPKPTNVKVSTMTIITNIMTKKDDIIKCPNINLDLFSRYAKVYPKDSNNAENRDGCIVGVDYYSNIKRGTLTNSIKKRGKEEKPFYNQATIIYTYWGFRNVNCKIFNNGKLQMTGIQCEDEAKTMTKYIINQLKTNNIIIYNGISNLPKDGNINDFAVSYNPKTQKISYYRWNYFQGHTNEVKLINEEKFNNFGWINDAYIIDFINKLGNLKFNKEQELSIKKDNGITQEEEDDLEMEIKCLAIKQKKLNKIREKDILVLEELLKLYKNDMLDEDDVNEWEFDLVDCEPKYYLDNIKIELINSDFLTNFNINNTALHNILTNEYDIFASYEPNDYPGVKSKYYWNSKIIDDNKLGCCLCNPPCASLGKKSVCTQITISIFQSGSIIITGAKSIQQIKDAYKFINNVLSKNYSRVLSKNDDGRSGENPANLYRKLQRKERLFYIEKKNIIGYYL